jgi:hypothetical protein
VFSLRFSLPDDNRFLFTVHGTIFTATPALAVGARESAKNAKIKGFLGELCGLRGAEVR